MAPHSRIQALLFALGFCSVALAAASPRLQASDAGLEPQIPASRARAPSANAANGTRPGCDTWKRLTVLKGQHTNTDWGFWRFNSNPKWTRVIRLDASVQQSPIPLRDGRPYHQWNKLMYVTFGVTIIENQSCQFAWRRRVDGNTNGLELAAYSWFDAQSPPYRAPFTETHLLPMGLVHAGQSYTYEIEKSEALCTFRVWAPSGALLGERTTAQQAGQWFAKGFAGMWYYGGQVPAPIDVSVDVQNCD